MSRLRTSLLYTVVAIVAAGVGFALAIRSTAPAGPTQALVMTAPRALPDFALIDHHGEAFGPARLDGQWTFLFFGFTHCPDICPTALQTLASVRRQLGDLPPDEQPDVVMISVDPGRDTPEQLATYVPYFDPSFLGVTGADESLAALTSGLGVAFSRTPSADGESYTVDHTAAIFLVNPDARLAAVFGTPHSAETIAQDYRYVVGESE
jgi:protein SCO1/2